MFGRFSRGASDTRQAAFGQSLTSHRARARSAWRRLLQSPPGGAAECLLHLLRLPHHVQYCLVRHQYLSIIDAISTLLILLQLRTV